MNDDDEDFEIDDEDMPVGRTGIILSNAEIEVIAVLLNAGEKDHLRAVWQGDIAVLWPMRMRPVDYMAGVVAD